jgi:quercetin dioxygenase-like cupin family protein/hemerythrin superfamily protein
MSGSTGDQANSSRPITLTAETLAFFPLADVARELETHDEYRRSGVAGITLVRDEQLTLMLVALRKGAVMREHRAPSAGSVVLLSGTVGFVSGDAGPETELTAGSLAVFSADLAHAVHARDDARYLVVIGGRSRPPEGAVAGGSGVTGSDAASATLAAATTVSGLLGIDHRQIDEILVEAKRGSAAGDAQGAASRLRDFQRGLLRHMVAEEEVLFPALATSTGGGAGGPISVMRHEHTEMRRLIEDLVATLTRGDTEDASRRFGDLTALLFAHNGKEERILYPMADNAAQADGSLPGLLAKLREALRADAER